MSLDIEVKQEYFDWLYEYVTKGRAHQNVSYRKLFKQLYETEFKFTVLMDINRAKDGVDLRYRFAMLKEDDSIVKILDGPCSVLEMIIALAIRCEDSIMDDTRYGDRTAQWFWIMLHNLGIDNMLDDNYDEKYVDEVLHRFIERRYSPDGKGGLFYIRNSPEDLRDVEIWIQLLWFLDSF